MLKETGVPTEKELTKATPPQERLKEGPVAVIECFEEIPCNPCFTFCNTGAITEFDNINDLPQIDYDDCTGCGICISNCPGLAIFVIDQSFSDTQSIVRIPWEMHWTPAAGDTVEALNRKGEAVCRARVERVQDSKKQDKTKVIWLVVDDQLAMEVRSMRMVDDK